MVHTLVRSVALSLVVLVLGCGGPTKVDAAPKAAEPTAMKAAAEPGHAAAGVKPGSHEDWCGEHEVPESLCTRCDPSLIGAFKASNDWCAEHGLPESQCKTCNPELKIVRPPAEAKP